VADKDVLRGLLGGGAAADEVLRERHVREALPRGPFAVYGALLKARRSRASGGARAAIDALLARRRVFVERIEKAPTMSTVNGIGTRLYGKSDVDRSDGSYVATLYATIFYFPVFPLSCWVVTDAPAKSGWFGGRQSWYFRAKVPLSVFHRAWRIAVFALAAAVALLIGFSVLHSSTYSDVRLVNGLDVAVEVTAGDVTETVPSRAWRKREFPRGPGHIVTRAGGRTIEELDADVPGGKDCVVYNVLGAAPVYDAGVVYVRDRSAAPAGMEPPPYFDLAGPSFVVRDGVDDAFTTPPSTVQFSQYDPPTRTRRHVDVADGGWRAAVGSALTRRDRARAAGIARRVAEAEPGDADATTYAAACLENAGDVPALVEFTEKALARDPSSLDAHRAYQTAMQDAGRLDEVRTKYRAAYDADRDSARAGYLYARIAPFDEGAQILERLVRLHPDDAVLRRALAWTYVHRRRFADALPQIERFEALSPKETPTVVIYHVESLAALGRTADAQRYVRKFIAKGDWAALMLYAKLARLPGADASMPASSTYFALVADADSPPVDALLAEEASLTRDAAAFAAHRKALQGAALADACDLRLLAFSEPEKAAGRAERAPPEVTAQIDDDARIALACELDRLGRTEAARAFYAQTAQAIRRYLPFEAIHALPSLDGVSDDLELETHAILEVAAARRTTGAAEKAALLDAARRDDVLRCIVPR
jgi:tetratricopeptide (TPR) repeat protein